MSKLLDEQTIEDKEVLKEVEELYISGGGGAGRSLPAALVEAEKFGLNLKNVKVVCSTSVGSILGLGIVLDIPASAMLQVLDDMPTDEFQDWNFPSSLLNFPYTWGWCKGKAMPDYFRTFIKQWSGLDDPTFKELQDAGFAKEFRVVTTNLDKGGVTIFSHKTTPYKKVADAVALSCSVPILFPPRWVVSKEGKRELHTDGGVVKNYPFGVGSDKRLPLEKQLGFIFVNGTTAKSLDGKNKTEISTFWQYLKSILGTLIFQHPLTLPEPVKMRTVAIKVNHNPMDFNASPEKQQELNKAGIKGVRSLIEQITKYRKTLYKQRLKEVTEGLKRSYISENHQEILNEGAEIAKPMILSQTKPKVDAIIADSTLRSSVSPLG